jgi:hypothetical protein
MEARMGGGNPSAQLSRALLCLHRAISRASPKSSCQAPSRPGWQGKLERSGRPRPGRRRGDARGGAGKWCESGNQTWASCTTSSRMGLWTASNGQPITPYVSSQYVKCPHHYPLYRFSMANNTHVCNMLFAVECYETITLVSTFKFYL